MHGDAYAPAGRDAVDEPVRRERLHHPVMMMRVARRVAPCHGTRAVVGVERAHVAVARDRRVAGQEVRMRLAGFGAERRVECGDTAEQRDTGQVREVAHLHDPQVARDSLRAQTVVAQERRDRRVAGERVDVEHHVMHHHLDERIDGIRLEAVIRADDGLVEGVVHQEVGRKIRHAVAVEAQTVLAEIQHAHRSGTRVQLAVLRLIGTDESSQRHGLGNEHRCLAAGEREQARDIERIRGRVLAIVDDDLEGSRERVRERNRDAHRGREGAEDR